MARVARRLAEAEAAFATFSEAVAKTPSSLVERDSAILRLIYTFEAVWKASQKLLAEREAIDVAAPNSTIRAARRLGWLSDAEAEGAMIIARDRNLSVHMYRGDIGAQIDRRLPAHAGVLRAWLETLRQVATEGGED